MSVTFGGACPISLRRLPLWHPLFASIMFVSAEFGGTIRAVPTPPSFSRGSIRRLGVRGNPMTMSDPLAKIKKKLQEEIDQLSHELNIELPKEIAVARAHGDLSENAEYKFAK